jgi:nucleoside-diphosphate-sugar epimerase
MRINSYNPVEASYNKSILITGAAGFTGTFLTKRLLEKNCKVKVLAMDNLENLKHFRGKISLIRGNICNSPKNLLKDMDVDFHLAAITRVTGCIKYSHEAFVKVK